MSISFDGAALPAGWRLERIDRLGELRPGVQRSPSRNAGLSPRSYLRAANVVDGALDLSDVHEMDINDDEMREYGLRSGDVLIAEASGSIDQVGRSAVWRGEVARCAYQNTLIRFRSKHILPEYAQAAFRLLQLSGALGAISRGVGILHLGTRRLASLSIPAPPLEDQSNVVEAVKSDRARVAEAEALLRASLNGTHLRDREVLELACNGRLIAGARDEPWLRSTVGDLGDVALGLKREPDVHYGTDMRPYLRVANVLEDEIDLSDVREMNFRPETSERYLLRYGDILLNEGQTPDLVGRPAMFRDDLPGAAFQMTLLRFRAGDEIDPEYALLVFRHYLHSGKFRDAARWSTNIAHLTRRRFIEIPIELPSLQTQRQIVEVARPMLQESRRQRELIDSALSRLPARELETLRLAITGGLTSLDPEASPLNLEGAETEAAERSRKFQITPRRVPLSEGESVIDHGALLDLLNRSDGGLPLPQLLVQAGYDRDAVEDVESFYLELRGLVGSDVEIVGDEAENAVVRLARVPRAPD